MRKIIISINTAWNVYNFRSGLIKALINEGYQVIAVAPDDEYTSRLKSLGCHFVHLPMDRNGTHPGRDLLLLVRYLRMLSAERPVAYLGYTIKPNVYGSIAAHILGIPVINNIAGLGATFINRNFLTRIVRSLYKLALSQSYRIFFQNADDQRLFIKTGLVKAEATGHVPGSGIDLTQYLPMSPLPAAERAFCFLLVARMLKDKGIQEFVGAARIVRQRFSKFECLLLGPVDGGNSNSISLEQIKAWEAEGVIRYLGKTDDVRPYLANADCVVLPSYREGVPRSLLEAAAMGRPIIATNVVGCRDAVDDGINGLLCQVRDVNDLAEKMIKMMMLSPQQRMTMGMAGRGKVECEFDEQIVIQKYLATLNEIASTREKTAMGAQEEGDAVPTQQLGK